MRLILVYLALIPMVYLAQDQSSNAAKPGMAAAGGAWMRIVRVVASALGYDHLREGTI
jgi:hypothetical protein